MDLKDLSDPIEVWKAIEGDPSDLVALLRSDKYIGRRTREALADYLAGELKPLKLPKGRPSTALQHTYRFALWNIYRGHDVTTVLGSAGFYYDILREFIRKKGWHRGNAGWSDRLKAGVARRYGIELEKFINYLSRSRPKPVPKPWSGEEYIRRRRLAIALDVRRRKKQEFE